MKTSLIIEKRIAPKIEMNIAFGQITEDVQSSIEGVTIDQNFQPIVMNLPANPEANFGADEELPEKSMIVRAEVEVESVKDLPDLAKRIETSEKVKVFADPEIAPIVDCTPSIPTAAASEIAKVLNVEPVWNVSGRKGDGVTIGIVNGGVDATKFPVTGGWSPDPSNPPGSSSVVWGEHGNMCDFDALIGATNAEIFDYAIGRTTGGSVALLSSALHAFDHALQNFSTNGLPQVLSNSWGLYQQSWDPFPPGHPSNYTHNMRHPFNRMVLQALDAGIFVVFAAGNCGVSCPDHRCGLDTGPGKSIRGANGVERVICVGAVNSDDEWIGYSSQGPSTLANEKPDICGFSHFEGYFNSDTGTSAACPTVAGVMTAIRAAKPNVTQDAIRHALRQSARQRGSTLWNNQFGYGIIDAYQAYLLL